MSQETEEFIAEAMRAFALLGIFVIIPAMMITASLRAEEDNFNRGSCVISCKTHAGMKTVTSLPTCLCIDGSAHRIPER